MSKSEKERKPYGFIYVITNQINGKQYIGQTTQTIKKRWSGHIHDAKRKSHNMAISYAINKYGKENFEIKELDKAYSQNKLNMLEAKYINKMNTLSHNGYNLKIVIDGKGIVCEKTKEKMRITANTTKRLKWASENGKKRRGSGLKRIDSISRYIGVCVDSSRGYIRAAIKFNLKKYCLGTYKTQEEAAKAYDIAAIKYFGSNAKLNFPELREDYINNKIFVKKNIKNELIKRNKKSDSNVVGVSFRANKNCWRVRLKGFKTKQFKNKEDAEKYCLEIRAKINEN